MGNLLRYEPTGVVDSVPAPFIPLHEKFIPTKEVAKVKIVASPMPSRCIGCRWHTPKELGGEGILCHQTDGKCPTHIIKWAISYYKNVYGEPIKSFANDDELLEALRL